MKRFRLAAIDLDGTLVDSAPDLSHCLGQALDSVGLTPPGLAAARAWIGDGVEALVRRGLAAGLGRQPDQALLARALDAFDRCYRGNLFRDSRVYPGVVETLAALKAAGMTLGCVTNKRERFARGLLEQAGLALSLDFVFGGDTFAAKKPDPTPLREAARRYEVAPEAAVMVGDSANDRDAARRAGFAFVFAAYGYASNDDPTRTDRHATIANFADLRELLCTPRAAE